MKKHARKKKGLGAPKMDTPQPKVDETGDNAVNNNNASKEPDAKVGLPDDCMWDESICETAECANEISHEPSYKPQQKFPQGHRNQNTYYRSSSRQNEFGDRSTFHERGRGHNRQEWRGRSYRSQRNEEVVTNCPDTNHLFKSTEPAWDQEEPVVEAPLPAVNIWEERKKCYLTKMEQIEQMKPKTEKEEEQMLREAIELSEKLAEKHQKSLVEESKLQMEYFSLNPKVAHTIKPQARNQEDIHNPIPVEIKDNRGEEMNNSGCIEETNPNIIDSTSNHGVTSQYNEMEYSFKGAIPKTTSFGASHVEIQPLEVPKPAAVVYVDSDNNIKATSPAQDLNLSTTSDTEAGENVEAQPYMDSSQERMASIEAGIENLNKKIKDLMVSNNPPYQEIENEVQPSSEVMAFENDSMAAQSCFNNDISNHDNSHFPAAQWHDLGPFGNVGNQYEDHTQIYSNFSESQEMGNAFQINPHSTSQDLMAEPLESNANNWPFSSKAEEPHSTFETLSSQPQMPASTTSSQEDFKTIAPSSISNSIPIQSPHNHQGFYSASSPIGTPIMSPMYTMFGSSFMPINPLPSPLLWPQPIVPCSNPLFLQQMQMFYPTMGMPMQNLISPPSGFSPAACFPTMPNSGSFTTSQVPSDFTVPVQQPSIPQEYHHSISQEQLNFIPPPVPASQATDSSIDIPRVANVHLPPGFKKAPFENKTSVPNNYVASSSGIPPPRPRLPPPATSSLERQPEQTYKDYLASQIRLPPPSH